MESDSSHSPPASGAYFRVIKQVDDLAAGELVLAWTEEGQIQAFCKGRELYYTPEEFAENFAPAPEGKVERAQQLQNALLEIDTGVAAEAPLLTDGTNATSTSTALITTQQRNSLVDAKRAALAAKKRAELLQQHIKGLLSEREKELELAVSKLTERVEKISYAISSINLYLGRDEEILCIQEGQSAPAEEPISIRQTVLFMDEETALLADEGGIDFKSLSDFDAWLCQPEHLSQILPEKKGIIAMRLRREEKWYDNATIWEQLCFQQANGGTYILVRNGERLWRIWNDIELPAHLIPTKAEFEELFHDHWDGQIRPGTQQYQRALNQAQGLRKRYLQAALILQGLLDRTQIFKPLPVERVNLLDPSPDQSLVRIIRDAENILTSGNKRYRDWLQELNAKLEIGKRIVFGGTSYIRSQVESRRENACRTRPGFTDWPETLKLYALSGKSQEHSFTFCFPREGIRKPGTFHVGRHDDFILNFDDAREDDIQFYLQDRCNRRHYLSSFPLLKAALALKENERQTEAPFVELLVREAAQKNLVEPAVVRSLLNEVIPWWKQKNRFSRNLTQDEKVAYRQILTEVRLRLEIQSNPAGPDAVTRIQAARPDWLLIGKDSKRTLVCLRRVPQITGLVTKEKWDIEGKRCLDAREWYMPDSENGRWQVLAAGPDWADWPKHGRGREFLTEPEYQELFGQALQIGDELKNDGGLDRLVAITASPDAFFLYGLFLNSGWSGPKWKQWACERMHWARERKKARLPHRYSYTRPCSDLVDPATGNDPNNEELSAHTPSWEKNRIEGLSPEVRALPFTAYGHRLMLFDEAALQEVRKTLLISKHKSNAQLRKGQYCRQWTNAVREEMERRFWEKERNRYLADGGLQDLWEDHKKTVKRPRIDLDQTDIEACLWHIVNRSGYRVVVGKSLAQTWGLAADLRWKPQNPEANRMLPQDFVFPAPQAE